MHECWPLYRVFQVSRPTWRTPSNTGGSRGNKRVNDLYRILNTGLATPRGFVTGIRGLKWSNNNCRCLSFNCDEIIQHTGAITIPFNIHGWLVASVGILEERE